MKIAFGYKMRSGKDTSVDYLIEKYGGKKITFASYLYKALHSVQSLFNMPIEKDRKFLQVVGDWAREYDPDIFVKLTLEDKEEDKEENYFCSDMRFVNEFRSLKARGWTCVKIVRDKAIGEEFSEYDCHVSENELKSIQYYEWDFIVYNNGTKEELFLKLEDVVNNIKNIKEKK